MLNVSYLLLAAFQSVLRVSSWRAKVGELARRISAALSGLLSTPTCFAKHSSAAINVQYWKLLAALHMLNLCHPKDLLF